MIEIYCNRNCEQNHAKDQFFVRKQSCHCCVQLKTSILEPPFLFYLFIYAHLLNCHDTTHITHGISPTCPSAAVAANLAVIRLQKIVNPTHLDKSRPLLSNSQPPQVSMCSCVSWLSSSQYLQDKLV